MYLATGCAICVSAVSFIVLVTIVYVGKWRVNLDVEGEGKSHPMGI